MDWEWNGSKVACGNAVGDGFLATECVREDGDSAPKNLNLTVLDVLMRGLNAET